MFRLFRFFSIASFALLLLGGTALSLLYRQTAVRDLMRVEQDKNVALTRTFANMIWPGFAGFFARSSDLSVDALRNSPEIAKLDAAIQTGMAGNGVVKVKIYGLDGRTLYSSQSSQIGEDQSSNEGWRLAVGGEIVNELTHRDEFNAFDGVIENRDVLASYIPIRRSDDAPVEAVFELYGDVTELVRELDDVQLRVVGGVILVLSVLYSLLLFVAQYAERVVREQYEERERAEQALRRRVALDDVVIRISARFVTAEPSEFASSVQSALEAVGSALGLKHVAAAAIDDRANVTTIAAWPAPPESGTDHRQDALPWLAAQLREQEMLVVPNVEELPAEAQGIGHYCRRHQISGALVRRLEYRHTSIGFLLLGVDASSPVTGAEMEGIAKIVADLIATALVKQQADATLAASEERLRTLVESMNDIIFTVDRAGRFTGFYGRQLDEYGLSVDATDLRVPADVFDQETAQLYDAAIDQAMRGENAVFDWVLGSREGRQIHLQTALSPVIDDGGAVIGAVGVGRDISELKRLERVKSEFIASVSHELRTPLASILGYAEILLRGRPGPLTTVQQEFLQTILDGSRRLKLLVDDLLDVSRIEVGKFRMTFDDVDLEEAIHRAEETIRPLADKAGITVKVDVPPLLPTIEGDEQRIGQVLDNLLSNAVKFSHDGGCVCIAVEEEDAALCVIVRDAGIGIPQEDIPHLFSRFYRASNAEPNQRSGTGLGLYITRAIVEGHGGRIQAESAPGEGTTIRFWLPKLQLSPLETSPDMLVKEIADRYFGN